MRQPLFVACLALAGCASYQPMTLPSQEALVHEVQRLSVDASQMPSAELKAYHFDPTDGLDITEVAMLAVANNPDLKSLRSDLGVSRAQAFSAGLLPDPQLALATDRVMGHAPGSTSAYSAGLTFDIGALIAQPTARDAAQEEIRKVRLDLLWQEWQTVAKARVLFVKIDALQRSQQVLAAQRDAAGARLATARAALANGLVSTDQATPLLTAYDDATRQWTDLERQRNQARHDLNALVGVAPDMELRLVGAAEVPTLEPADVYRALKAAPGTRPDLLALQAGLKSQDAKYRGAIRAQFPAITIGPTRARDTSNVNTLGLSLGITLPLFNRNRGNIAIESATRDKLLAEYQQRLNSDTIEVDRLMAEQSILRRQADEIAASIAPLRDAAAHARQAYEAHNIDAFTLTTTESSLSARLLEQINTRQALQEQAIALQALLGGQLDATPAKE